MVRLLAGCLILFALGAEAREIQLKSNLYRKSDKSWKLEGNKVVFNFHSVSTKKVELEGQTKSFEELSVADMGKTSAAGAPELPFVSVLLVGDANDIAIDVNKGESVDIAGLNASVAPETKCRCKEVGKARFDAETYYGERAMVRVESFGKWRGLSLSRLVITPARVTDNGTAFYPDMTVSFEGGKVLSESAVKSGNHLLVVTPSRFSSAVSAYVDLKREEGFRVTVKTTEEFGSSAGELKESFHELYASDKYDYALIVGDEDVVATSYVFTQFDNETPSDWPYFAMDGEDDVVPEVFYARLAVNSVEEIERFVAKLVENKNTSVSHAGFNRTLGVASNEGSNPSDEDYIHMMLDPFGENLGTSNTIYVQESSGSASDIARRFSEGLAWMNYIGHGSGPSWPSVSRGEFHIDRIKDFAQTAVKPVVIDVACQNGRFSHDGRIGERLMNEERNGVPLGAVAYYGGSVDISWHPPAIMAVGITQAVAGGERSLSGAIMAGHLHLMNNHSVKNDIIHNFKWYHLQGDPTHQIKLAGLN